MPHNNYLLTREGKWITVSDDELYHWKYIKREKVNGKWRYYYTDTKLQDAAKNAISATQEHQKAKDERDKNWDIMMDTIHTDDDKTHEAKRQVWWDSGMAEIDAETKKNKADRKYKEAREQYQKSAGHKVADLLNKSSDAIDKAKSWVNNLFKKKSKKKKSK